MKEYRLEIVEKMTSMICVEAESEDDAYEKATEELSDKFYAPYHIRIYVEDWNVIGKKDIDE